MPDGTPLFYSSALIGTAMPSAPLASTVEPAPQPDTTVDPASKPDLVTTSNPSTPMTSMNGAVLCERHRSDSGNLAH
jgi:hypothetical protein